MRIGSFEKSDSDNRILWENHEHDEKVEVIRFESSPYGDVTKWKVKQDNRDYETFANKTDAMQAARRLLKERTAFLMGREEAKGAVEAVHEADKDEIYGSMRESLPQSARWANTITPDLRRLAGFEDSGVGTYQDGDMDAQYVLDELIEMFWNGAYHEIDMQTI